MGELEVSDGGMFKCSGDHSKSREEHSEQQRKGTSLRRSETQQIRFSSEASRYIKLKPRAKGSLGMSQFVTLVFSIKRDAPNWGVSCEKPRAIVKSGFEVFFIFLYFLDNSGFVSDSVVFLCFELFT